MSRKFRVGLSRDFLSKDGKLIFKDIGLSLLDAEPNIEYEFLDEHLPAITAEQVKNYDGFIALGGWYKREMFEGAPNLTVLARHGVGYDKVDIEAATDNDVMVCITPAGIRRPVAEGALTLIFALAKRLFAKDRLVRKGRWQDKIFYMGNELQDKTLGSVGLGNIASELFMLVKPIGMRLLAFDPFVSQDYADTLGVTLVDWETLFRESDFISVNCLLNEKTRGMIGAKEFALMKPTAYFVNTARGGIVDQKALTEALREKRIQGAGLDVFEVEPIEENDLLLELDNVILAPHAIGWTDEGFRNIGMMNCQKMIQVSRGEIPDDIVNKKVLERPGLKQKLEKWRLSR